eukprot:519455-Hanusia_phi.AAC.2
MLETEGQDEYYYEFVALALTWILESQGDIETVLQKYRDIRKSRKNVSSVDGTSSCRLSSAILLHATGKFNEALYEYTKTMQEEIVCYRIQSSREKHLKTLLAVTSMRVADIFAEALKTYEQGLSMLSREATNDESRASCYASMSFVCYKMAIDAQCNESRIAWIRKSKKFQLSAWHIWKSKQTESVMPENVRHCSSILSDLKNWETECQNILYMTESESDSCPDSTKQDNVQEALSKQSTPAKER